MFRLQRAVYLDNNATTPVSRRVRKKTASVLKHHYGNPSSLYKIARDSASILEESRAILARTVGAKAEEIIFTGSATEANNQILRMLSRFYLPEKRKIIASPIEHPSVMSTLEYLVSQDIRVEYLPVDSGGRVRIEALERMIDAETFLVCCMLANNEIGTIQDVKRIAEISRHHGAHVMSDCVQALGKIDVDVQDLGIDYATFSAHKIHGPKGVGAAFVRSAAPVAPLIRGGHQEAGLRAGTEGVHDIAGFAEACRGVSALLSKAGDVEARRDALVAALQGIRPDLQVNSPMDACLPNTLSVTFPGVNNAILMAALDAHGIAVSVGSACSTSETKPSHVLKAIGLSDDAANSTIRLSLSETTSNKDLRYVTRVTRDFFEGKTPSIRLLRPGQVDESFLFDSNNYLLDIRFWHERKLLRSLPNSFEASFIGFARYVHHVPRDKHIVVVCMGGIDAAAIAYGLRRQGWKDVSILLSGVAGWRLRQPHLYRKHAGRNVTPLAPRSPGPSRRV